MDKNPTINIIYNRKKQASSEKKAPLEIRITYNYQQKWISTGIMLYPYQWKNGMIVNCPDIIELSEILEKQIKDIRKALLDMMKEGDIDLSLLSNRLRKERTYFLDFCKQRAEVRKFGKSEDTKKRYNRFLKLFTKYGRIQHFEDLSERSIIQYDNYLDSLGMKPYSKWNNYHRFLNSFIIDAIDAGYIKKNPYKWVKINKEKSLGGLNKYLTYDELIKLKNAVMTTESMERVRDVFIFQAYTCLSYTDLKNFDCKSIQEIKGMKVYIGSRKKTKKTFTVPLLPAALGILEKYNYNLPIISNVKYNMFLKTVAQNAGIDKPISSHWARHTGATILLNEGIDMGIVSKICGHSSTKITEQIYAKLLDETVVDAISKIKI